MENRRAGAQGRPWPGAAWSSTTWSRSRARGREPFPGATLPRNCRRNTRPSTATSPTFPWAMASAATWRGRTASPSPCRRGLEQGGVAHRLPTGGRGVRPAASITRSNSSRVPLPFSRRRRGCRTKASGVRAVPGVPARGGRPERPGGPPGRPPHWRGRGRGGGPPSGPGPGGGPAGASSRGFGGGPR